MTGVTGAHVQMEVVPVRRIVFRPQRDGEQIASAGMEAVEEFGFLPAFSPESFYIDQAPVFEAEA